MVVVKWSEKVEGYGDNIDPPLCCVLFKEEDDSLFPWSGTYPYAKVYCLNCSKEENDWIVPGYQYIRKFKNWRGPIHNGPLRSQTLKEKIKTAEIYSKYVGSAKINTIPR